jgi:hypothetical protein
MSGNPIWEEHPDLFAFVRDQVWQECAAATHVIAVQMISDYQDSLSEILVSEKHWKQRKSEKRAEREGFWAEAEPDWHGFGFKPNPESAPERTWRKMESRNVSLKSKQKGLTSHVNLNLTRRLQIKAN